LKLELKIDDPSKMNDADKKEHLIETKLPADMAAARELLLYGFDKEVFKDWTDVLHHCVAIRDAEADVLNKLSYDERNAWIALNY
jgi:hypothetical protein